MGLSRESVGIQSLDRGLVIVKQDEGDRVVALAGNPNVGKSTVFNELTGMHQHTGNWPGKTVANAQGYCRHRDRGYVLVDIPGCYSLLAHSAEEEVARDFICFGNPDAVVVVCDATCLERNLNLVIQVLEAVPRTVVCVNLMDEAEKKKLTLDLELLEKRLKVPVVGAAARSGRGLTELMDAVEAVCGYGDVKPLVVEYPDYLEDAIKKLMPVVQELCPDWPNPRWLCARLLDADAGLLEALSQSLGVELMQEERLVYCLARIKGDLEQDEIGERQRKDDVAASFVKKAEEVCDGVVHCTVSSYNKRDRKLDRLFTSRATGFPIMLLLLCGVFWLTITGANYPSELLSKGLFWIEDRLLELAAGSIFPVWLTDLLICGVYRVVAWIISVLLPPMAILFPLFPLLEDFGYLPRVAFNLDKCFQKCCACGKQALTMCQGKSGLRRPGVLHLLRALRFLFLSYMQSHLLPGAAARRPALEFPYRNASQTH